MTTVRSSAIVTRSREGTERLGEMIGRAAREHDVVALWGDLGSGKTTFVRGIARGLDIPERDITSPTFVIVHEHEGGRLPLFHIDLYRIAPADAASTGWEDALAAGGVTAIEWPDRVAPWLPSDRLDVRMADAGVDAREIRIEPTGPRATRLRDEALA